MSKYSDRLPRVTRIELSEKNKKLRMVLICVLLAIGVVAIGYGLFSALNVDGGWRNIEITTAERNCASDFVFSYCFDDSPATATEDNKRLSALYSDAAEKGYWLFNADEVSEEIGNLGYVNANVNKPVTVDPVLYQAFAMLEQFGNRHIYLGPVYAEYDGMFFAESDAAAAYYDPDQNLDLAAYFADVLAFANDPQAIRVELLGDNKVQLHVAQDYVAFASENEITAFLDFHWMTNAFLVDFLADQIRDAGFTSGFIASYDGFTRNLDATGRRYSQNIIDRYENSLYPAAVMSYTGAKSLVYLRNFPLTQQDRWHYRSWEKGTVTTSYISLTDARSKTATDMLLTYSGDEGCAQLLLRSTEVYIADTLNEPALTALAAEQVYALWAEGTELRYTQNDIQLTQLMTDGKITYTARQAK